jgi:hypothetical protein
MEALSLTSFITPAGPVKIVANENLEGHPLITPLLDKDGVTPKIDILGKPLGSIMLEQNTATLNGSFLNNRRRVAFISGSIEGLQKILDASKAQHGTEVPGKIVVKESIYPGWEGQQPKINPQTKKEIGVIVGEKFFPVYMKMFYTDNLNAKDVYVNSPEDVTAILAQTEAQKQSTIVSSETAKIPGAMSGGATAPAEVATDGGAASQGFVDDVVRTDATPAATS